PGQKIDIAAKKPELVETMRAAYEKWWKGTRPLMINEDAPLSETRPYHVWYNKQLKDKGIPQWKPPTL
ncbi:MAG: arylsulfatase, partial [Akkermansiaceae bacterium]